MINYKYIGIILLLLLITYIVYIHITPQRLKVYVSFTTIPSRIDKIKNVLDSLRTQTYKIDQVVLNIPYYSNRFKKSYELPDFLSDYNDILIINRCEDYGPGTKLLGILDYIYDYSSNDVIIIIDDDRVIESTLVESLVNEHIQYPDKVIANYGSNQELPVKIPWGAGGILIPVKLLDKYKLLKYFKQHENNCRYVDDVFFYKYFTMYNNYEIMYSNKPVRLNSEYNPNDALYLEKGELARYNNKEDIGLNQKCLYS